MPVIDTARDLDALTLTLTAEYDAPVERCWQLWADPRQLERWWGPPTYPATFVTHDLTPGAVCGYFMTSPEGDRYHAWWRVLALDPPHSLEVEDGFGEGPDDAGDLPVGRMRVVLAEREGGGTRMTVTSIHASRADLEQVLGMGQEEGMREAAGQIDGILAGG